MPQNAAWQTDINTNKHGCLAATSSFLLAINCPLKVNLIYIIFSVCRFFGGWSQAKAIIKLNMNRNVGYQASIVRIFGSALK